MVAELICVGTEILLGNIVNTNAAYLAEQCAALGISCYYQTVVGDNRERLLETIGLAKSRADLLIFSGGLGPTEDDLTRETTAEAFNRPLLMDEHTKGRIETYFKNRYKDQEIPENNWRQAMVPEGAIVLDNENGTAPGLIVEDNGKTAILLPGPPNELKPMFAEQVVPYLKKRQGHIIRSKTAKLCGIGESAAEEMIKDLIDAQENPTIATYAKTGEVHIRITAKAKEKHEADDLIKPILKELKNRFGSCLYSTKEDVTLEQSCVEILTENKLTISTMESCTGGMVAARLTNVPGVSQVFKAGYVTYSPDAKRKILGVKKSTLKKETAVSPRVAKEMVKGVVLLLKTDVALSVTGLAGPGGGSKDKPIGLVYIACRVKDKTRVMEYHFSGSRAKIREAATAAALTFLRQCLWNDVKSSPQKNKS